jgi:hypothetical protein
MFRWAASPSARIFLLALFLAEVLKALVQSGDDARSGHMSPEDLLRDVWDRPGWIAKHLGRELPKRIVGDSRDERETVRPAAGRGRWIGRWMIRRGRIWRRCGWPNLSNNY